MRAQIPYFLRRSLRKHTILTILLPVFVYAEGVFIGGVEEHPALAFFVVAGTGELSSRVDDVGDGLEELDEGGLGGVAGGWHVQIEHGFEVLLPG